MKIRFNLQHRGWQWAALILLALMWGSSFILMKKALHAFTHIQVVAFRMVFSFLMLLPLTIRHFKLLRPSNLSSFLIIGFLGNALPGWFLVISQTQINSSLAGMINTLLPVCIMLVGVLVYKATIHWMNMLGVLTGLLGAIGMLASTAESNISGSLKYALLVVLAVCCYSISVNETKYRLQGMEGMAISSLSFIFVGPLALCYLPFSGLPPLSSTTYSSLLFVFVLSLCSSVLATLVYNALLKHTTPLFFSMVTYLIPIVAMGWGLMDGETITSVELLCMGIIFLGVYLVNKKRSA